MIHSTSFRILSSLAIAALCAAATPAQSTERVSVSSAGAEANGASPAPETVGRAISFDGRFVAFSSLADNLVAGDTNGESDVFVRDHQLGTTVRVSSSTAGVQGNGESIRPAISDSGRYVVFQSAADNLVPGDTNQHVDIFIHDLMTAQTARISVKGSGIQANHHSNNPAISADGRFIVYQSLANNLTAGDANGTGDVFLFDRQSGATRMVSRSTGNVQGNGASSDPAISSDGKVIAYRSSSTNLVGSDTNSEDDVFVHDLSTFQTTRVSLSSSAVEGDGPSRSAVLSADGNLVLFDSAATNLVANDLNGARDVFVHDRSAGTTELVSISSLATQGNYDSAGSSISLDGRLVGFNSIADNLVQGDTNGVGDGFLHDRQTGQTSRITVATGGVQVNGTNWTTMVSGDGSTIAFWSAATNLVLGDVNGALDVFVTEPGRSTLQLVLTGTCPGAVRIQIRNATPGGWLPLFYGTPGAFIRTNAPCLGLPMGLSAPILLRYLQANGAGLVDFTAHPTAAHCGTSVQAVNLGTCTASNVAVL